MKFLTFFWFCGSFFPSWIRPSVRIQLTKVDADPDSIRNTVLWSRVSNTDYKNMTIWSRVITNLKNMTLWSHESTNLENTAWLSGHVWTTLTIKIWLSGHVWSLTWKIWLSGHMRVLIWKIPHDSLVTCDQHWLEKYYSLVTCEHWLEKYDSYHMWATLNLKFWLSGHVWALTWNIWLSGHVWALT